MKDSLSVGYASLERWTSPVSSPQIVLHGISDSHILIIKKRKKIARAGHNPGGRCDRAAQRGISVNRNGNGNKIPVEAQYLYRKAIECADIGGSKPLSIT